MAEAWAQHLQVRYTPFHNAWSSPVPVNVSYLHEKSLPCRGLILYLIYCFKVRSVSIGSLCFCQEELFANLRFKSNLWYAAFLICLFSLCTFYLNQSCTIGRGFCLTGTHQLVPGAFLPLLMPMGEEEDRSLKSIPNLTAPLGLNMLLKDPLNCARTGSGMI